MTAPAAQGGVLSIPAATASDPAGISAGRAEVHCGGGCRTCFLFPGRPELAQYGETDRPGAVLVDVDNKPGAVDHLVHNFTPPPLQSTSIAIPGDQSQSVQHAALRRLRETLVHFGGLHRAGVVAELPVRTSETAAVRLDVTDEEDFHLPTSDRDFPEPNVGMF